MRSLWSNIFRRGSREEQELHELLGRIPLFERLSRRELQAVAKILYRRRYKTGEYVFHQGDIGIGVYIIEHGSVAIVYEPTAQLLTELRDGDFFGEVALLNETRRSAAARAESETTLLCMLEPDLEDLGARNPRIGFKVLRSLAQIAARRLIAVGEEYEELRLSIERPSGAAGDTAETGVDDVGREGQEGDGRTGGVGDEEAVGQVKTGGRREVVGQDVVGAREGVGQMDEVGHQEGVGQMDEVAEIEGDGQPEAIDDGPRDRAFD